jgi:NAD(P)-dependent dehydrogenase (short-subunit alcohol dehydrogenase family)/pimeloyl-ACP methyl ester carboxylesterase
VAFNGNNIVNITLKAFEVRYLHIPNPGQPTLVVLPGGLQNIENCSILHQEVHKSFNYFFLELPGTGSTTLLPPHYPYQFITSCMYDFYKEYIQEPFHLTGISYGASVALSFAKTHARLVNRMILIGVAKSLPDKQWPPTLALLCEAYKDSESFTEAFIKLHFFKENDSIPSQKSLISIIRETGKHYTQNQRLSVVYNTIRLMSSYSGDLSPVTCPTLCFTGEYDSYTPPEEVSKLASELPNGYYAFIPNADHFVLQEQPRLTIDTAVNFLLKYMPANNNIKRYCIRPKYLPAPDHTDRVLPQGHVVVVTNDGTGTSSTLCRKLADLGWKAVLLNFPVWLVPKKKEPGIGIEAINMNESGEAGLKRALDDISDKFGPVAGFIHISPIFHSGADMEIGNIFVNESGILLKQVFLFAKHLQKSLKEAAEKGFSFFVTATRLDGKFGLGGRAGYDALSGGMAGLVKTLNHEWKWAFCRAIDLNGELSPNQSANLILDELMDPNKLITESGYDQNSRYTVECKKQAGNAENPHDKNIPIGSSSVLLVSGGARGITSSCVIELAKRCGCKFILLGRTKHTDEPDWAKGCSDSSELKKRISDYLKSEKKKNTPAMIQEYFNSITSSREISCTLKNIRESGGEAEYCCVDILDEDKLKESVETLRRCFGKITGVIHGAGVLADKLIEKKSEKDYDSVFSVKVSGLLNILKCVVPEQMEHVVLFSSTVGLYGNAGQSDYAMANEVLNKSAYILKHKLPGCRVLSINWGPWDSGMVTMELKKAITDRNISLIPPDLGARMFVNELASNKNDIQIAIGSYFVRAGVSSQNHSSKKYRIKRKMSPDKNPFLKDHMIGEHCVLPAACAISWLADSCLNQNPGFQFFACEDFKVLKGVVFDDLYRDEFYVDVEEISRIENEEIKSKVKIWSYGNDSRVFNHYSGTIILKTEVKPALRHQPGYRKNKRAVSGKEIYKNILFHGPAFQGVKSVLDMDSKNMVMDCVLNDIHHIEQGQFQVESFNPYILDTLLQGGYIWIRHFLDSGSMPVDIEKFERFRHIPFGKPYTVHVDVEGVTGTNMVANIVAFGEGGTVYYRIVGAKATYSKMWTPLFNRLK